MKECIRVFWDSFLCQCSINMRGDPVDGIWLTFISSTMYKTCSVEKYTVERS